MTQQHPITPPPELVQQWFQEGNHLFPQIADKAAQWAADQELEACCKWIHGETSDECFVGLLRSARRPKPPSLKERALAALERYESEVWCEEMTIDSSIIRRALEQLDD